MLLYLLPLNKCLSLSGSTRIVPTYFIIISCWIFAWSHYTGSTQSIFWTAVSKWNPHFCVSACAWSAGTNEAVSPGKMQTPSGITHQNLRNLSVLKGRIFLKLHSWKAETQRYRFYLKPPIYSYAEPGGESDRAVSCFCNRLPRQLYSSLILPF